MSVLVCGSGISALSAACALKQAGLAVRVLGGAGAGTSGHFAGLWSPALQCLDKLGVYDALKSELQPVTGLGIRDLDGDFLACPDDLAPPLASPSLAFVRRDTLLARLRMQLSGDELQHGMVVEKVFRRGQKAVIESNDGTQFEADFVVAADGYRSRVREVLHGSPASDKSQYCGYKVYKGHTLRAELPSVARSYAENITATFQTWGPGKRFAVVPTRDGYAWCATVTSSLRADSYSREQLAQGFSDWHKPLEALVLHSEGRAADMAVCDAYSTITKLAGWEAILRTEEGQPEYVNKIPSRSKDLSQSEEESQQGKQRSVADIMQAAYQSNNVAPLVVYVGDAAGAIDPSGWHGAGLGIESGFNLAQTIQQARLMHDRQVEFSPDVIAKPGKEEDTVMNIENMKMHLLDFESIRERRLRKIQLLSSLSSRVSHVESESLCRIRKLCFGAVPGVVKKSFLNYLIHDSVL